MKNIRSFPETIKTFILQKFPIEDMSIDVDEHPVESENYEAETAVNLLNDALQDDYIDDVDSYAKMDETMIVFKDRQALATNSGATQEKRHEHNAESPTLSGGDIDAAWDQANDAGSETVSGTAPTPGQNDINEMGKALGIEQERNQPLNISQKRRQKDEKRWELNPDSAETQEQEDG